LEARATPRRDKRSRVVHSLALYSLGISLMETASDGPWQQQLFSTASRYRDGLIIALMAARPLRIRNFQDIDLGRTLKNRSGTYWLEFDEDETKTGRPIGMPVPQRLTPYLEAYLRVHRKMLLAFRSKETLATRCLWVSKSGEKVEEPAMRTIIMGRTRIKFGHAIDPHCFATVWQRRWPPTTRSLARCGRMYEKIAGDC
jgi:integrase/recombinase XerD